MRERQEEQLQKIEAERHARERLMGFKELRPKLNLKNKFKLRLKNGFRRRFKEFRLKLKGFRKKPRGLRSMQKGGLRLCLKAR